MRGLQGRGASRDKGAEGTGGQRDKEAKGTGWKAEGTGGTEFVWD